MTINFRQAKRIAAMSLAMSSCAFFLLTNQNSVHAATASDNNPVVQTTANATTTDNTAANNQTHVNLNDQSNYAWLDSAKVENQTDGGTTLSISGWHATNQAINKPNHYIILLDRTTNQEIARQKTQSVSRPDVALVHSGVANADQSGFSASFSFNKQKYNLNHRLEVVSRYTSSEDGNSDYVDYWFSPLTSGNAANQGFLDNYNYTSGKALTFSGWHATDLSPYETNHFAILFDETTGSQVAVTKTVTVSRRDVARVYPKIANAANSGFSGSFDLSNEKLNPGDHYAIVSRYSTSNVTNGGNGEYTDFWSPVFSFTNQSAHYIDSLKMTDKGLQISGWMIADQSLTRSHPYIIVLNNGHEIARQSLTLKTRNDVAKVYPHVYNSANSGFSTTINLDPSHVNGTLQLILRFTDDPAGNGHFTDQYSANYASGAGWFDQIRVNGNNIYVSGWHASNQAVGKKYQYLIFLGQNGHELYRQKVLDKDRLRKDVAKVNPAIYNADHAGFQLGFAMPSAMNHQLVRVIHRITDDPAGNGNYVDYTSDLMPINVMRTPIDYRQSSEYAPYPNLSKLNNFWIHVRIRQNRVYLMNGNNIVYIMYCTAGTYRNGVSDTPTGTYYIQAERGNSFYNAGLGEGANYWTSFLDHGVYLFHSVPTDASGNYKAWEASQLGISQGSHGCIRLSVPDAYWFMHNVPTGTRVVIEN